MPSAPSLSESRLRAPVIKHGNAGNQTKDPASATISKESGGLPHGMVKVQGFANIDRGNSRTMVVECFLCNSTGVKWGFVWVWSLSIGKHPRRRVLMGA